MKVLTTILIFLFCISCSEIKKTEKQLQKAETNQNLQQTSNVEVILEISSDFESHLAWIKGTILNFRLYADGSAEFDDCPLESNKQKQLVAAEVCKRLQIKIDESELNELKEVLSSREAKNLNKKYQKIVSSCDSVPKVTVKNKDRATQLIWCDNLGDPKTSPEFPKILTKIIQISRDIKNKTLGKEVIRP